MAEDEVQQRLLELYRRMVTIREFEELTIDVYRRGLTPGLVHASSGQEAVAVGVTEVMEEGDYLTSTHRGHGHCIARGMSTEEVLLEILGRDDGCCRGKGGSMHIADPSRGIIGANGIVAGGLGIAAGAAFTARYTSSTAVSVVFLGEGAMSQGVVYETMNMAALWSLPLVYVCENNGLVEFTRAEEVTAGDITDRSRAFGLATESVDGMDVEAVGDATARALARARAGEGATFLEMRTYRYHGHHVAETNSGYRTDTEIEEWRARDPLLVLADRLRVVGVGDDELEAVRAAVLTDLEQVRERALASPVPTLQSVHDHVFAESAR